mgnify:CR=1 FL=1
MFTENLAPFFSDFASAATLDGASVSGIFDNQYIDTLGIASRQPMFTLPTADAAAATTSSVLVVEGVTYRVRSIEPDGTGVTMLMLERQ